MDDTSTPKNSGGLYKHVKVSVKTVNAVIAVGIAVLAVVLVFVATHNGFSIGFDTDGGSYVESVVGKYGEYLTRPEDPVKEGWSFIGWFTDRACTNEWDFDSDTLTGDLTLYAGWEKKPEV